MSNGTGRRAQGQGKKRRALSVESKEHRGKKNETVKLRE